LAFHYANLMSHTAFRQSLACVSLLDQHPTGTILPRPSAPALTCPYAHVPRRSKLQPITPAVLHVWKPCTQNPAQDHLINPALDTTDTHCRHAKPLCSDTSSSTACNTAHPFCTHAALVYTAQEHYTQATWNPRCRCHWHYGVHTNNGFTSRRNARPPHTLAHRRTAISSCCCACSCAPNMPTLLLLLLLLHMPCASAVQQAA
jgi:hypothetical protein